MNFVALRTAVLLLAIVLFWSAGCSATDDSAALLSAVKAELNEAHPFFRQAFVDLDSDGRTDAIVLLAGRNYCGSGGCGMIVFRGTAQGFKKVSTSTITSEPIHVLPERLQGWKGLIVESEGDRVMRFNGSRFPLNPSLQPKATSS